jgi:acetyl esterase/lipase
MRSDYQAVPAPLNPDRIDGAPYFEAASPKDPFVVPAASVAVLKTFPPTLFITGSRAAEMSSAAQSHLELIELGVRSQLLIFDGMEHGFTLYPIPEATRAHGLLVKFFLEHLGRQRSGS